MSKQGASIRMYDRDLSKRDETLTHINNDRKSLIDGGLISESHVMVSNNLDFYKIIYMYDLTLLNNCIQLYAINI